MTNPHSTGNKRVTVDVPDVPEHIHPSAAWRKSLTGLDEHARRGAMVQGKFLAPGTRAQLATGALVLVVDKATTSWTTDRTRNVPVHAPTLVLYQVEQEVPRGPVEIWRRSYKTTTGAWGATTRKALCTALEQAPQEAVAAPVVHHTDRRGPNARTEPCHWCAVAEENARLVALVEHECPARV